MVNAIFQGEAELAVKNAKNIYSIFERFVEVFDQKNLTDIGSEEYQIKGKTEQFFFPLIIFDPFKFLKEPNIS